MLSKRALSFNAAFLIGLSLVALSAPIPFVEARSVRLTGIVRQAPSAPVLTLTSASTTANSFSWPDVATETSYRLERSTGTGSWSSVETPAQNATSVTNNGTFVRNTPYAYRLFAVNGSGDSPASNVVHTTLPPDPRPVPSTSNSALFTVPSTPTYPRAGGMYYDPTFGTPVYRISDAERFTGAEYGDSKYGYWPTFNSTVTRLQATLAGDLCEWNSTTKVASNCHRAASTPDGPLQWEVAIWSGVNPDLLYGVRDTTPTIWKYNASSQTWAAVKNLSSLLNANEYPYQISMSLDDDRFGFTIRLSTDFSQVGYAVYDVSADSILYRVNAGHDEVQLDKTGRYLVVKTGVESPASGIETKVVDLNNGNSVVDLTSGSPDFGFGHSDSGSTITVSADDYTPAIRARSLATPHTHYTVHTSGGTFWATDGHMSLRADDESWFVYSVFGDQVDQGDYPYSEEIVRISTDGAQRCFRYLHHFSVPHEPSGSGFTYQNTPRANVSRDGKFIAFTSSMGSYTGRRDLFVAEVPLPGRIRGGVRMSGGARVQ